MSGSAYTLRKATIGDVSTLEELIRISSRGLGRQDYTEAQIEGALESAWGVDTELIRDETYFVAQSGEVPVGCGGWSRRKTLFGGDRFAEREGEGMDPSRDAARIRAFFVHPDWARQGIGRALLERCEWEARAEGFRALELMATLPGVRLYRQFGYQEGERVQHPLGDGLSITFVKMRKDIP